MYKTKKKWPKMQMLILPRMLLKTVMMNKIFKRMGDFLRKREAPAPISSPATAVI